MAINKKKSSAVRVKKKKWYPIHASEHFNNALLGETYLNEETELGKKFLTANLSTITKSMRKQNINIHFKVNKVEDGKAYTEVVGYSMINAAIKRLVRRGRDKITDSFLAKTKAKEVLRMKPLIITSNKGTKALQSAIRLESRRVIREFVFAKDTKEVFAEIIEGKLQKQVKDAIAKLAPVRSCELRMVKIDTNTKVVVTDDGVRTEKVTIRKREKSNQLETQSSTAAGAPEGEPKAEKTQAEEYEESQASASSSEEEIVANEAEFDENETVEEELSRTTEESLDADEEEVMVTQGEPTTDVSETPSEAKITSEETVVVAEKADKKKA